MSCEIRDISFGPSASGSAGPSARPSVKLSLRNHRATFSTPVFALRQPQSRSGLSQERFRELRRLLRVFAVVSSTDSGFPLKAVNHPDTGYRRHGFDYHQPFTPVLRGYESTVVGRSGLRGREPQLEPRHGHGACPRAAKARPADAVPPLLISQLAARHPLRDTAAGASHRRLFLSHLGIDEVTSR